MSVVAIQSPGKYIQGAGIYNDIAKYLSPVANKFVILVDPFVLPLIKDKLEQNLTSQNIKYIIVEFKGECCHSEVNRVMQLAIENHCLAILGIGGGKTLDTAKAVGFYAKYPIVLSPTIASTDAPCAALSVLYTDDGIFDSYLFLPNNANIVLIDTQIVANAPSRLLAAGMGDALATWFEARACHRSGAKTMAGELASSTALNLAKLCFDTLMAEGRKAMIAVQNKVVTPAVERIVEANTYLSGVGFESGGLAAAHAVHNGLTTLDETHKYLHGEKVAFGVITQLILENASDEELVQIVSFCYDLGLPISLSQIGVTTDIEKKMHQVATESCSENDTMKNMPGNVQPQDVYAALIAANQYGENYLSRKNK